MIFVLVRFQESRYIRDAGAVMRLGSIPRVWVKGRVAPLATQRAPTPSSL